MKAMLEYHILQNFAPSNLNRDDTGSPKDAMFGQAMRGRVSSQCLKRAMRTYVAEHELLAQHERGTRTMMVLDAIAERLAAHGHDTEVAKRVAEHVLGGVKLKFKDARSQYLLFLGNAEIDAIATILHDHWETLAAPFATAPAAEAPAEGKAKAKAAKASKQSAKEAVPAEITTLLNRALDGGKAVDVALFGRMVADSPDISRDAACQVAHALSTHRIEREFDFFTAVDDLKGDDTAGADMLGTVEFSSACYYRYGVVDLAKLVDNLGQDRDLALRGLRAFMEAAINAKPTGKQNTFAAHQDPGFVAFTVRTSGAPRSLANAFERPVSTDNKTSLTGASAAALAQMYTTLTETYGGAGALTYVNVTDADLSLDGRAANSAALLDETMANVRAALGAA